MDQQLLSAISDFVNSNRKSMASYLRQKLLAADAKPYLDRLGKSGIEEMEREAGGLLLDLACALLRRLHPGEEFQSEAILAQLSESERQNIRLPRSDAYYAVLAELQKMKPRQD
jgi:hypothetical protein